MNTCYMWNLSRRIAMGYAKADAEDNLRDYAILDDFLVRLKKLSLILSRQMCPDCVPEDIFVLSEGYFPERYDKEVRPYEQSILRQFPNENIQLWKSLLFDAVTNRRFNTCYNGLTEETLERYLYMKNVAPYLAGAKRNTKLILSPDEISRMNEAQVFGIIYELEAYDMAYGTYGFGIDFERSIGECCGIKVGQCYIKKKGKTIWLPVYGHAYGFTTRGAFVNAANG